MFKWARRKEHQQNEKYANVEEIEVVKKFVEEKMWQQFFDWAAPSFWNPAFFIFGRPNVMDEGKGAEREAIYVNYDPINEKYWKRQKQRQKSSPTLINLYSTLMLK
jgi:hypothetical protein